MGSKHIPARWYEQGRFEDECAAADSVFREERVGSLLYRYHTDGSIQILNLEAVHRITFKAIVEGV